MSEARNCPFCGSPSPIEIEGKTVDSPPPLMPIRDVEADRQSEDEPEMVMIPLLAPGSNDDDFVSRAYGKRLIGSEPDPILREFVTPTAADHPEDLGPSFPQARPPHHRSEPVEVFPPINFDAPPGAGHGLASSDSALESDEEEEVEEGRGRWSFILLASYSSAITLALGWLLLKDRSKELVKPEPKPQIVQPSEGPRQGKLSGEVIPPEPLEEVREVQFGQTTTLGMLEITPIDVKRQSVKLRRSDHYSGTEQPRDGGKNALALRLKLRNVSADKVFAPLDQAYLRQRGKQVVDTFVTTEDGERIFPFPLVVDSELSIDGQDFTELRPGESRTVSIVTAAEAPPDSAGPFHWRVRLRTGVNRNDAITVLWPSVPGNPSK